MSTLEGSAAPAGLGSLSIAASSGGSAAPAGLGSLAATGVVLPASDYITVLIGGVRKNQYLKTEGAIQIQRQLNGPSSCTLIMQDTAQAYLPALGQPVQIFKGTTLCFAGFVSDTDEADKWWGQMIRTVTCSDWKAILDRRIIFAEYVAGYNIAGIVLDLIGWRTNATGVPEANTLAGEGFTMRHVDAGPTFSERIVFSGITARQAFDQLAAMSGYDWYVDWDKDIHFSLFATNPAPFSITDTSANWRNLHVRKSLRDYRNVQHERNSNALNPRRTDTFTGDGLTRFFVTRYPLWGAPTITVGGVVKTVGLLGVDSGKDWYWVGPSSYGVENLAPDPPLAVGAVLAVTYPSDFPAVVTRQNATQIATRAALEGGSGRHEAIEDISDVAEEATAVAIALGNLARYGDNGPPTDAEYETDTAGLEPGQIQTFNVTKPAVSDTLLIEGVSSTWICTGDNRSFFRHQIKATSGYCQGDWRAYWARLADRARNKRPIEIETHSWDLAETISGITPVPLATGDDVANPVIIQRSGFLQSVVAAAKTAPTGADIIIDILINGTSIFLAGAANQLHIPAGSTAVQIKCDFVTNPVAVNPGDVVTVNVEQVGSTVAGQDITVYLNILPTPSRQP